MIGLIVLSALVVYLTVAIVITALVAKWIKNTKAKWAAVLACIAIFILIPTWDEILGRLYFKYLCETEGGVRIYKTVELGPEYWDEGRRPKFVTDRGDFDQTTMGGRFTFDRQPQVRSSKLFRITKRTDVILDAEMHETISTYTYFIYFGGWLVNHTGAHVSGTDCYGYKLGIYEDFLKHVFTRIDLTK